MAGTVNKPKKPKSKRGTTRLRHKIEKASAAKQRKQRKLAKKNPEWRTKLKKDPGIPNLFPYKDKLLDEIEQKRVKKAVEAQRRRDMVKAAQTGAQQDDPETLADAGVDDDLDVRYEEVEDEEDDDMQDVDESNPMAALLASAKAAAAQYDQELAHGGANDGEDTDSDDSSQDIPVAQESSRKSHDKVFKQVVEQADVVLYVLDARDPEGTRSREVERSIMAAAAGGKRLILILNKIDLVPPRVLRDWLVYLRRFFPTLPLRASGAAANARTHNHRDLTVQNTAATLFRALKSFAASRQLKRSVSVGVIGYPNVGKSSVINALLGRMAGRGGSAAKACPAGAEAGVTTSIRAVKIDSKLTLLDSPGIVFPSTPSTLSGGLVSLKNATEAHAHLILLNAVPTKQIDDPIPAVSLLIRRLSASSDLMQKLIDVYDIPPLLPNRDDGDLTTDFLIQVARKRGRLGKGGVPNLNAAAMTVVTDWRDGRIQGWVEPPSLPVGDAVAQGNAAGAGAKAGGDAVMPDQKEIVTEWAAEFKLEGLWGDGQQDVEGDGMEQS